MNHLYLVRHGENLANLTLEFSHRKVDYSLTPKGRLQARQTAEYFHDKGIQAIYTSPLKRASETAQIIGEAVGLPVEVVEHFREVNVGELEGQKPTRALWAQHDTVVNAWNNGHPEACFPGGEDYPTLLNRIRAGLDEVLTGKDNQNLIIVGHGGMFTFTLRDLCQGMDDISRLDIGMPNCSITELLASLHEGVLRAELVRLSSVDHLNGEAADLALGAYEKDQPE